MLPFGEIKKTVNVVETWIGAAIWRLRKSEVRINMQKLGLSEVGVRQKHIKHILGKIGNSEGNTEAAERKICTLFCTFRYVN